MSLSSLGFIFPKVKIKEWDHVTAAHETLANPRFPPNLEPFQSLSSINPQSLFPIHFPNLFACSSAGLSGSSPAFPLALPCISPVSPVYFYQDFIQKIIKS
jgi:hypothetical protein